MFYSGVKYKKGVIFYTKDIALRELLYTLGFAVTDDLDILNKQREYSSLKNYNKVAEITWIESEEDSVFNITSHSGGNWIIEIGYPPTKMNVTLVKLIEFVEEEVEKCME